MDGKESIGLRLKAVREAMGLSQGEVARQVNARSDLQTRAETISRYESGKYEPSGAVLAVLADVLQTTVDYILRCRGSEPVPVAYADSDLVESVIRDLDLDDDIAADLRATNWSTGLPSEGTLRSYALDLRKQKREQRASHVNDRAAEPKSEPVTPLMKRKQPPKKR